ncbi:MAG: DeoR/GlpR family DNA-binding transcription regulator [Candidatus Coproplasma sp.]
MLTNERQEQILSILKKKHSATVKNLAAELFVSDATIRRDLNEMQKLGLIERSHGGAVILEEADEVSIFVRINENAKEKERAAFQALNVIPKDFKSVFLDSSSTVLALAQRLDLSHKTVMTNNLQTAIALSRIDDINLLIPGGNIFSTGNSVVGSWTTSLLKDFSFDLMLCSCAAIKDNCAYENSIEQREVKRTAFERSERRIIICDHSKLNKKATYMFQPLTAFDNVVFDYLTDEDRNLLKNVPVYSTEK